MVSPDLRLFRRFLMLGNLIKVGDIQIFISMLWLQLRGRIDRPHILPYLFGIIFKLFVDIEDFWLDFEASLFNLHILI
jgi:hypothetical protein